MVVGKENVHISGSANLKLDTLKFKAQQKGLSLKKHEIASWLIENGPSEDKFFEWAKTASRKK